MDKNKSAQNKLDLAVHEIRVMDELIFQLLIKQEFLFTVKLQDIKIISHRIGILIRTYLVDQKNRGIKNLVTAKLANQDYFIINMIKQIILNEK